MRSKLSKSVAARARRWLREPPPADPVVEARRRGARIGDGVHLPRGSELGPHVAIGDHTSFSGPCRLDGVGGTTVGRWCAIGFDLVTISSNHDPRYANMHIPLQRELGLDDHKLAGPIRIGDAVWIGDRVTVLAGADIGTGSVIGAGAVVRGSIPSFSIAAGVPAKVVRRRFADDVCAALEDVAWWDLSIEDVRRRRALFELDLTAATADDVRRAAGEG